MLSIEVENKLGFEIKIKHTKKRTNERKKIKKEDNTVRN
jgi:hypothetical protein